MNLNIAGAPLLGLRWARSLLRPGCQALITPQAVVLNPGGKTRPIVRQCINLSGTLEMQFAAAVNDVLQMMDVENLQGRRLQLVVSDYWARPVTLPIVGKPPGDEQIEIVLQNHYRRTYGDLMNGWQLCWAAQAARLVAVAWPTDGLDVLRGGLARRGCILAEAKPLTIDIASKALPGRVSSWLAIMEPQSITLVHQQDGLWQDWCVSINATDMAQTLSLQLARETACCGDKCRLLTLVNLNASTSVNLIRKTLIDAAWTLRVWPSTPTDASMGYRLSQIISGTVE